MPTPTVTDKSSHALLNRVVPVTTPSSHMTKPRSSPPPPPTHIDIPLHPQHPGPELLSRIPAAHHASSPTPTTPTLDPSKPGVLDFSAFPHFHDLIVGFAPRASLIALRAASRRLRDLCDARLVRHIVFTERGVETPTGRIPSEDWYERPEIAQSVAFVDLLLVKKRPADVDPEACFCTDGSHLCGVELLAPYLTNLKLVRIAAGVQSTYPILSAPRIQFVIDTVPHKPQDWAVAPGDTLSTACVSDVHTVTLFVTFHPGHPLNYVGYYYWLVFPPTLRHLIICYRLPNVIEAAPSPMPEPDPRELARPELISTLANSLCRGTHGGLKYSLVGVNQIWGDMYRRQGRNEDPSTLGAELLDAARVEGKRLLGWDDERADACLANVECPTVEEYRAGLGEFELELSDDLCLV